MIRPHNIASDLATLKEKKKLLLEELEKVIVEIAKLEEEK